MFSLFTALITSEIVSSISESLNEKKVKQGNNRIQRFRMPLVIPGTDTEHSIKISLSGLITGFRHVMSLSQRACYHWLITIPLDRTIQWTDGEVSNENPKPKGEDDRAEDEEESPSVFVDVYHRHFPLCEWLRRAPDAGQIYSQN